MNNEDMGIKNEEDVERNRRAYANASVCCRCGVTIPPRSPVWMLPCRLIWAPPGAPFNFYQDTTAAGCRCCRRSIFVAVWSSAASASHCSGPAASTPATGGIRGNTPS